ncbi:50S ribosomal protein L9 [Bartonella sp. DGB1]|uniref:50S ribosomal protein L9 n=1 Tax=Bartonella sp. DGB1 TaxID=3239807 RepID=UPI003526A60F
MKVILLERVLKLGQMGEIVDVKPGYARNYLIPQQKALRASAANLAKFENQKIQLEAQNLKRREEAEYVAEKLNKKVFTIIRAASETGQLYGSVATRDIVELLKDGGFTLQRSQIQIANPIKILGLHTLPIYLHADVKITITINIARTPDEAEKQLESSAEKEQKIEEEITTAETEE